MSWTIWPKEGNSINVLYQFGSVALSSADTNWHMTWVERS